MADIPFRKILGQNQQTYQRLKLALSLHLRRQIFVAVCDDLTLRDRLAAQLVDDLSGPPPAVSDSSASSDAQRYPRLVSLTLNLSDPNPIGQIAQWAQEFPPPRVGNRRVILPIFQILGIEQLTRQPAAVQRLFLAHLESIERNLAVIESGLVLWVSQPWFNALPQSAPDFWRCRSGTFEFLGEPTLAAPPVHPPQVSSPLDIPPTQPVQPEPPALPEPPQPPTPPAPPTTPKTSKTAQNDTPPPSDRPSPQSAPPSPQDELWQLLSGDRNTHTGAPVEPSPDADLPPNPIDDGPEAVQQAAPILVGVAAGHGDRMKPQPMASRSPASTVKATVLPKATVPAKATAKLDSPSTNLAPSQPPQTKTNGHSPSNSSSNGASNGAGNGQKTSNSASQNNGKTLTNGQPQAKHNGQSNGQVTVATAATATLATAVATAATAAALPALPVQAALDVSAPPPLAEEDLQP
ncbi:MAG TPA: hypothetical protein V6C88_07725, partial [Chroococcidiopsis sp.]